MFTLYPSLYSIYEYEHQTSRLSEPMKSTGGSRASLRAESAHPAGAGQDLPERLAAERASLKSPEQRLEAGRATADHYKNVAK